MPRFAPHYAAEVTVIGEADVGGKPGEVALAVSQAIEHVAHAKAHPVARNRMPGRRAKCAAQMVRRDRERSGQVAEGCLWPRRQRFANAIDQRSASAGRRGPTGGDSPRISTFKRASRQRDCPLNELVRIRAIAGGAYQQPMLEVDPWRER